MLRLIRAALWAACVGLPAAVAQAPVPEPTATPAAPGDRTVPWQRSLADAEALARATGRPLLLALNMDGESASDRVWHETWRDPRFVALARRCVCVGASVFRHQAVDHDADGRRRECPRFPGLTCAEHQALEPQLFERYFRDGERVAPRHAVVRPDGSFAFDLSLCFDLDDVTRALAQAVAEVPPAAAPPLPATWAALAARRDAAGRAALEDALGAAAASGEWRAGLAALVAHGDAGALPALRRLLAWSPEVPPGELAAAAAALGLAEPFAALLRERAQRLGAVPGDLALPADFAALRTALATPAADLRTRVWLVGGAAAGLDAALASGAALAAAWPAAAAAGPAGAPPARLAQAALPDLLQAPVRLDALLAEAAATAAAAAAGSLPRPGVPKRDLPEAEALHPRLAELDAALAQRRDDPALLAAAGMASLDLGRRQLEAGAAGTQLFYEDAVRYLQRALAGQPDQYDWWLELARATWALERHDQQFDAGRRALQLAGFAWPPDAAQLPALRQDARAVEALRWLGDALARQFARLDLQDPIAATATARGALLALGHAAASPFGDGKDWVGFASFAESLGLVREELAILLAGVQRLPAAPELRQALHAALWLGDRAALAPGLADAVARAHPGSADARWWAGHVRLLWAEELRRQERPAAAVAAYAAADAEFAAAAALQPDYADSARQLQALGWLGQCLAQCQGPAADRAAAAAALQRAVALQTPLQLARDGLGYDALDAVDKLLEWRAAGPSPVAGPALHAALRELAPAAGSLWTEAIADSLLREALRADGRNPLRAERDTVDAGGQPVRALLGLPTALGDDYLAAARQVAAGLGADERDEVRWLPAQILTIAAERQLDRGRTDGVAADLAAAAALLRVPAPPADAATVAALRAAAAPLRQRLGPARPRQRDGR